MWVQSPPGPPKMNKAIKFMIKLILLICISCLMLRTIAFIVFLIIAKYRIESLLDKIIDSLPDERSVKDFMIELNKVDCIFYEDSIFDNYIRFFSEINPKSWISPQFISLIENRLSNNCDK